MSYVVLVKLCCVGMIEALFSKYMSLFWVFLDYDNLSASLTIIDYFSGIIIRQISRYLCPNLKKIYIISKLCCLMDNKYDIQNYHMH